MKTKHKIVCPSTYGANAIIPKGTPVTPAYNQPDRGYWVEQWEGMTAEQKRWDDNYGYHVSEQEVTE